MIILLLLLSACEKEPVQAASERTILFYLAGNNNLWTEVDAKVEQIKAAPLDPKCRVLIYKQVQEWHPQLFEVVAGKEGNSLSLLRTYKECYVDWPEQFEALLHDVAQRFPASSYGLVLFSHASGWLPALHTRSVAVDGNTEWALSDFAAAIPNEMFSFIVFESCSMAGVEVAWELKDKTEYIIASSAELISPGFSPCYPDALPHLYQPQIDLLAFCRTVEDDYRKRQGDYASLTLSLIATKELDALSAVIQGCDFPTDTDVQSFDRNGRALFFDFEASYLLLLSPSQAVDLQMALDNCVVWKTATEQFMPTYGGFEIFHHSGLTTYIMQERYAWLNEVYMGLKWTERGAKK
ncbi:MAG: hypothetical protein LBC84_09440 [Prevotellaceae bacterium]|nr:hypothetical protein [Prevotellaceae bacterium]